MPEIKDLVSLVKGPIPEKPLVAVWAVPPNTAGVVGGIPDMIRYYKTPCGRLGRTSQHSRCRRRDPGYDTVLFRCG
jgi:hypothetical protein